MSALSLTADHSWAPTISHPFRTAVECIDGARDRIPNVSLVQLEPDSLASSKNGHFLPPCVCRDHACRDRLLEWSAGRRPRCPFSAAVVVVPGRKCSFFELLSESPSGCTRLTLTFLRRTDRGRSWERGRPRYCWRIGYHPPC